MKLHERVAAAEAICGHTFTNKELIEAALTHPSAVEGKPVSASYERLEFLGDSILGAIIATELFERYPDMDEGQLTRLKISLVSGHTLSIVSDALGISPLIVMFTSPLLARSTLMRALIQHTSLLFVRLDLIFLQRWQFVR